MLKKLLKITKQITQYVDSKSVKIDCPYSTDLGVSPSQDELLGHSLPLLHLVLSSLTHLRLGILS